MNLATGFIRTLLATATALVLWAGPLAAEATLLMVEEPGCMWCARWNSDIAPIYPKTAEGAAAPLRRINLNDPLPADITLDRKVNFTPTFVLLVDGTEQNRIEGYPGDEFFWFLLARMLTDEGIEIASKAPDETK